MNCELMKAEEARAITENVKQAIMMNTINEIANKIKIAAGVGQSYIDWHGSLNSETYYFLESQGYQLKDYDDYNENETYTEISWR